MAILALITSWVTPTTLFLLLNLMIGTVFITSRFGSGSKKNFGSDHSPNPVPLARAPSLIDRVKSINLNLYKFPTPNNAEPEFFNETTSLYHNSDPLARAPSLLDRVKSINFSYFKFPQYDHEKDYAQTSHPEYSDPTQIDRIDSNHLSQFNFDHIPENDYPSRSEPGDPETSEQPRLTRAPSLLQRVKSINFSPFYRSEPTNPEAHLNQTSELSEPRLNKNLLSGQGRVTDIKPKRSKSERSKTVAKTSGKMTKSASEKSVMVQHGEESVESVEMRRPETARFERSTSFGDGEQGVDAKASDFISKFKQQLKLQRLDSILRNKEMLKSK